jgi:hypothetical protein
MAVSSDHEGNCELLDLRVFVSSWLHLFVVVISVLRKTLLKDFRCPIGTSR